MIQNLLLSALLLSTGTTVAAASDLMWRGGSASIVPGACDLKILVWNIERGEQLPAVTDAMRAQTPAITLLQEVDRNASRSGRKDIPEELARSLGLNYVFAAEFEELGQGQKESPAYHGQAVLTALRFVSARTLRFRDQTDYWQPRWYLPNWAVFQRRLGGRLALVAEVETASRRLVVYNVHLESRGPESLREREMQEVIADASRYSPDTPVVVAGDLNTRLSPSPVIAAMKKAGFRLAVGGDVSTLRGAALDWIFVRGAATFREGKIHKQVGGSDHFPLTVQVRLEPPPCR